MSEPEDLGSGASRAKRAREEGGDLATRNPRKRKKPKKAPLMTHGGDEMLNLSPNVNTAIEKLDSLLLADYVARSTKHFAENLSLVELEDKRIRVHDLIKVPVSAFTDTSDWKNSRTLDDLPKFLDHYSNTFGNKIAPLASASKSLGSPHTLVVTSAGLRAADLTRALRLFRRKDAAVAKLFAKHIKLREAIDMVRRTRMGFGVGTPIRIIDLLDSGALSLSALDRIVVDFSHIDQKKRGIFDMRETQEPLIRLLNRPELKDRFGTGDGNIQLLFY